MITLAPIGVVRTASKDIPRHWSVSLVEGTLVIDPQYRVGLRDIEPGQLLVVIFHFHQSRPFTPQNLVTKPPHLEEERGVFSTCAPTRPNPLGLSIVRVLQVDANRLQVQGIDMLDGTPILDLKPYVPPVASAASGDAPGQNLGALP
jgi:tRNA-Thr(GGU) m(6)t(6)A37 methyltransferase TsaA